MTRARPIPRERLLACVDDHATALLARFERAARAGGASSSPDVATWIVGDVNRRLRRKRGRVDAELRAAMVAILDRRPVARVVDLAAWRAAHRAEVK